MVTFRYSIFRMIGVPLDSICANRSVKVSLLAPVRHALVRIWFVFQLCWTDCLRAEQRADGLSIGVIIG